MVGGPQSFSQAENRFQRSLWTVHMKFKEVLLCLRKLAKENIKSRDPNFTVEHPKVREDRFWLHFKGAIGAIGGSHIKVSVRGEEVVNHTNQHGYTSQNILAVCDFDMRFTFVVAGWPNSAHDTRILNHALTNFGDQFPKPPAGTNDKFLSTLLPFGAYVINLCSVYEAKNLMERDLHYNDGILGVSIIYQRRYAESLCPWAEYGESDNYQYEEDYMEYEDSVESDDLSGWHGKRARYGFFRPITMCL
jgi:hypothetical protein